MHESETSKMNGLAFELGPLLEVWVIHLSEYESHRIILLPPKIFAHVQILVFFLLTLLAFSSVYDNGSLAFIFTLIAYSVITVFVIRAEFVDTYGTDWQGLPSYGICAEITVGIRDTYRDAGMIVPQLCVIQITTRIV